MNIIPYGHSGVALYRVPWVTIVIFVVCLLAFVLTNGASDRAWEKSYEIYREIIERFIANPTLELEPRILEMFLRANGVDEYEREVYLESLSEVGRGEPPTRSDHHPGGDRPADRAVLGCLVGLLPPIDSGWCRPPRPR